jgi:hypothetical protein
MNCRIPLEPLGSDGYFTIAGSKLVGIVFILLGQKLRFV